jgi:hypothetical protein
MAPVFSGAIFIAVYAELAFRIRSTQGLSRKIFHPALTIVAHLSIDSVANARRQKGQGDFFEVLSIAEQPE